MIKTQKDKIKNLNTDLKTSKNMSKNLQESNTKLLEHINLLNKKLPSYRLKTLPLPIKQEFLKENTNNFESNSVLEAQIITLKTEIKKLTKELEHYQEVNNLLENDLNNQSKLEVINIC